MCVGNVDRDIIAFFRSATLHSWKAGCKIKMIKWFQSGTCSQTLADSRTSLSCKRKAQMQPRCCIWCKKKNCAMQTSAWNLLQEYDFDPCRGVALSVLLRADKFRLPNIWVEAHLLMCGSLGCESGANGCYVLWGNSGVHCKCLLNGIINHFHGKDILSSLRIQRWLLLQTVLALSKMSTLLNACDLCLARTDWRLSYVVTCIRRVFICTDLCTTTSLHKELLGFWKRPV